MDEGWFGVFQFCCDIPCQSEIRILVNGARNEARDARISAKDLGERVGK